MDVYDRLGVTKVINGAATLTRLGGSIMPPEVRAAMAEAAGHFVEIDELQARVGAQIAEWTHNEAAYVSCGAAAGLVLSTAACIAGLDPDKREQLPRSQGLANEVIVQRKGRVGYDFALGRNREGNISKLAEYGKELGYSIEATEAFKLDNQVVSSSRIRFLLGAGQVAEAAKLLNRNYSISGTVILGDQRGRTIGFPTANLDIWKMRTIPAAGVYACSAKVNDMTYGAVANIGVRPTFENTPVPPRVEAHLLDFQGDIYGDLVTLEFLTRIRDEQRFTSVDDLVYQIERDALLARQILA